IRGRGALTRRLAAAGLAAQLRADVLHRLQALGNEVCLWVYPPPEAGLAIAVYLPSGAPPAHALQSAILLSWVGRAGVQFYGVDPAGTPETTLDGRLILAGWVRPAAAPAVCNERS